MENIHFAVHFAAPWTLPSSAAATPPPPSYAFDHDSIRVFLIPLQFIIYQYNRTIGRMSTAKNHTRKEIKFI